MSSVKDHLCLSNLCLESLTRHSRLVFLGIIVSIHAHVVLKRDSCNIGPVDRHTLNMSSSLWYRIQ